LGKREERGEGGRIGGDGNDLFLLLSGHVVAPVHAVEQGEREREEHTREDVDFLGLELEVLDVVLHPGTENSSSSLDREQSEVVFHREIESSLKYSLSWNIELIEQSKIAFHPGIESSLK
jgi:hypothetical protein